MAFLRVCLTSLAVYPVASLNFDVADAKKRPVTKVITLLNDMLKQLEKEATDDEDLYDKMACWCKTNDKEKSQAISDAQTKITTLTSRIEEHTANSARLNVEIENHEKEVAGHQQALDTATALREKEVAEFNGESKDLLGSVQALKAAITVLSKHHKGKGFLQVPQTHLISVAATLKMEMLKHANLLEGVLTPAERKAASAFVQAPDFKQAYAPGSGEIFGILRQMKETFESNLSASEKEELANQQTYEGLKAAKEEEILAGQAQIDTKTVERSDTDEKKVQAKVDVEDTKNSLSADEQFLMMLKDKCKMTDNEWEERQKTRQDEMTAISKAVAVLSSDDNHDLFTRTFNPSFIQTSSHDSSVRTAASHRIAAVARKFQNPRLSTLAEQVQLDAFTRVKKAIDDMVSQLLKEKEDEVKHKDFCTTSFNENALNTERKEREKEDLTAKIEDLDFSIQRSAEELEALKAEIAEMQVQLKRAGEDREQQNKEFQTTVADARETQHMLKTALGVLADFYRKTSLSQTAEETAGPAPPEGFKSYQKNAASGGVMSLLEQIINDAKAMETESVRSEENAQKSYEDFVKESNTSVESKNKEIINKSSVKANDEESHIEKKRNKEGVLTELEQFSNYNAELRSSCDFVMNNFEVRQTARDEEVEALRQAKAILSGADFQAAA